MQQTISFVDLEDLNTTSGMVVAFILFIFGLFVVRLTHHRQTLHEQFQLFVVAYIARIAMILLIYNGGLISIVTDMDSSGWRAALVRYQEWSIEGYGFFSVPFAIYENLPDLSKTGTNSHVLHHLLYASIFTITGMPGRITAAALNALISSLVPVFGYRMSIQIFGDAKAARYLGWVLALMPSLLVFSALTAKEPFVVFLEVLGLYCCVQIAQQRYRVRYLLAFAISTFLMLYLRFYIFNVLIGSFIAAIVVPVFVRRRLRKAAIVGTLALAPVVLYVGYNSAIAERNENTARSRGSLTALKDYGSTMGGNSYVENPFDITKPSEFLPGLLFGLVHLMYAPFPWNLFRGSNLMLLTTPEVLWWYYSGSIRFFRGLRYGLRANFADAAIPILFCLPLLYYYSLMFSNIGLAYRYRAQIYPELILFIGMGYKRLRTIHGYQSYALPEEENPEDEFMPEPVLVGQYQPWLVQNRFDSEPAYQEAQWQNRNDRFRRI